MTFQIFTAGVLVFFNLVAPLTASVKPSFVRWLTPDNSEEPRVEMVASAVSAAPERVMGDSLGVRITAASAIVSDRKSGAVLYEKDADKVRPLASITKLVSLLVVIDRLKDPGQVLEITKSDFVNLGYNNFAVGEKVEVKDLIATAIIASDNTAVQTLSRATGLSSADFVAVMNSQAADWGLSHTHFDDPTGLSARNVSTAREVLIISDKAFARIQLSAYAGRKNYRFTAASGQEHLVVTTNQLIGSMVSVVAGKTGFVTESGYNLTAAVTRDGHELLGVTLGSDTSGDRFQDFKMLVHWVWENYDWSEASPSADQTSV